MIKLALISLKENYFPGFDTKKIINGNWLEITPYMIASR